MNFGTSRAEYENLTRTEISFIYRAWEDKLVRDSTFARNAFLNAYVNANRKKGTSPIKLWKKHFDGQKTAETAQDDLKTITAIEDAETGWIEEIYKANGIPMRKKAKKGDE